MCPQQNRNLETTEDSVWWKKVSGICNEWFLFGKEMVKSPVHIGAICPSSKYLGRSIARHIPMPNANQYIVELGAGTGRITQEILAHGIPPENLILIERSSKLCELLAKRFKNCQVIHGDASDLLKLLGEKLPAVQTIISSLPLISLPPSTVQKISEQLDQMPANDIILIQFTYKLTDKSQQLIKSHRLNKISSQHVWRNIPPARLDVYKLEIL